MDKKEIKIFGVIGILAALGGFATLVLSHAAPPAPAVAIPATRPSSCNDLEPALNATEQAISHAFEARVAPLSETSLIPPPPRSASVPPNVHNLPTPERWPALHPAVRIVPDAHNLQHPVVHIPEFRGYVPGIGEIHFPEVNYHGLIEHPQHPLRADNRVLDSVSRAANLLDTTFTQQHHLGHGTYTEVYGFPGPAPLTQRFVVRIARNFTDPTQTTRMLHLQNGYDNILRSHGIATPQRIHSVTDLNLGDNRYDRMLHDTLSMRARRRGFQDVDTYLNMLASRGIYIVRRVPPFVHLGAFMEQHGMIPTHEDRNAFPRIVQYPDHPPVLETAPPAPTLWRTLVPPRPQVLAHGTGFPQAFSGAQIPVIQDFFHRLQTLDSALSPAAFRLTNGHPIMHAETTPAVRPVVETFDVGHRTHRQMSHRYHNCVVIDYEHLLTRVANHIVDPSTGHVIHASEMPHPSLQVICIDF